MSALLTLEEAQRRLLALAPELPTRTIRLTEAAAKGYLTSDLKALRTQPAADLSAMDGYAIAGEGPWEQVGESRAGQPYDGALKAGQCTRISTGAHMPDGTDRVLIQENAGVTGMTIALAEGEERPAANRHVRKAGFDFHEGETVLHAGTRLSPASAALALAAGHCDVEVRAQPTVAVLDSGDELVPPGQPLAPHQIPATNAAMLSRMLQGELNRVDQLGPVADAPQALAAALEQAKDCHILITSGGASVGDHDLIQKALFDWGAELDFWKVAIKPGKPLMVATRQCEWGRQVILGLPGNPVSSFVTAFLFALPLVRQSMGARDPMPARSLAIAEDPLPVTGKRREFLRGVFDGEKVRLAASQDSSALRALAQANCLIDRPADASQVAAGDRVTVYNLQNG